MGIRLLVGNNQAASLDSAQCYRMDASLDLLSARYRRRILRILGIPNICSKLERAQGQ